MKDVAIFPLDPVAVDSELAPLCRLAVLHLDHESQNSTCVCHNCFFVLPAGNEKMPDRYFYLSGVMWFGVYFAQKKEVIPSVGDDLF
jgi:hypothetical protein